MRGMDVPGLIAQLEADGPPLAAAAARAGWDAPVPGTGWDVRSLVTHVGGVHRWATAVVSARSMSDQSATRDAVGAGPVEGELLDWFRTGHAELTTALRAAPEDLTAFTFLPADSPKHFWSRRQAHETAIHRIDAEGASGADGAVMPVPAEFAQDGMAEMLLGFARRKSNASDTAATIAVLASDGPSWLITFGGERIQAVVSDDLDASATVSGTSSDLYRWLWNRPSPATVTGDEDVLELWRQVRVRWG